MMVFMLAAQWADEIKGDSTYGDDGSNGGKHSGRSTVQPKHRLHGSIAAQVFSFRGHAVHDRRNGVAGDSNAERRGTDRALPRKYWRQPMMTS